MTGTDKLIQKITDDARKDADRTVEAARERAEDIRLKSAQNVEKIKSEGDQNARQLENDILFRARKNAELEAKKADLEKRHEIIDKAFCVALSELRQMGANECADLMKKLIFKEAEGGEEICPSAAHESIIKSVLPDINNMLLKERRSPLTMGYVRSDIRDGFIMIGKGYVKTCTYEELLQDVRERETGRVADILF